MVFLNNKVSNLLIILLLGFLIGGMFYLFQQYKVVESDQVALSGKLEKTKAKLSNVNDKLLRLDYKNKQYDVQINSLRQAMSADRMGLGLKRVKAFALNIRQNQGTDLQPVGVLFQNALVEVVDTSNPIWYKVKLSMDGLNPVKKYKYTVKYANSEGQTVANIQKQFLKDGNLENGPYYYLHSSYLSERTIKVDKAPSNPSNPFVYGLLFFDDNIKKVLEGQIWSNMKDELFAKGYDGIKVVPAYRKTFIDDVNAGKYDAVESSPGDFISANKNGTFMKAFAKTVNKVDNSTSYSGIIIVNRNSGINSFEDLRGKTIYARSEYSESGYRYQKYFLKKFYDIDIEEDANVETGFGHQEVLLRVAKGEADAGFCGDFVMTTTPLYQFQWYTKKAGVVLETEEQLERMRDSVKWLRMDDAMPEIPNNPHSIKKELYNDRQFVDKLRKTMIKTYNEYKEEFGLTTAITAEYEQLREFELE